MFLLLAVRPIDVAIFGTLGTLWLGGAIFIVLLYRWIRRFEGMSPPLASGRPTPVATPRPARRNAALPNSVAAST